MQRGYCLDFKRCHRSASVCSCSFSWEHFHIQAAFGKQLSLFTSFYTCWIPVHFIHQCTTFFISTSCVSLDKKWWAMTSLHSLLKNLQHWLGTYLCFGWEIVGAWRFLTKRGCTSCWLVPAKPCTVLLWWATLLEMSGTTHPCRLGAWISISCCRLLQSRWRPAEGKRNWDKQTVTVASEVCLNLYFSEQDTLLQITPEMPWYCLSLDSR